MTCGIGIGSDLNYCPIKISEQRQVNRMDSCDSHGRSSSIGWKNEMADERRAHSVLL